MSDAHIEHVNITVSDAEKTAQNLCRIFGWHIRWHGHSMSGGYTYHVGTENSYLAVYQRKDGAKQDGNPHERIGRLNHIGILVEDLDQIEQQLKTLGYKTFNHGDYEPGRRFYFYDEDGIEFEIVSYVPQAVWGGGSFARNLSEMAKAGITLK